MASKAPGNKTPRFPEQSRQDRLRAEKQKTKTRIKLLSGDVEDIDAEVAAIRSDDEHDPEGSTLAFERAKTSTLLKQELVYLKEIEKRKTDSPQGLTEYVSGAAFRSLANVWRRFQSQRSVCSADPCRISSVASELRPAVRIETHPNGWSGQYLGLQ